MKEWFELKESERSEIFKQTAFKIGLPPAAVEKDWWVMTTLRALFDLEIANSLIFKGGTSLSKAWGLIDRFSEDIDLAMDRSYFGFNKIETRSTVKKLRKASCQFANEELPQLLKSKFEEQNVLEYEISVIPFEVSDTDPVAIEIKYKSHTEAKNYILPRILVEISSRSLQQPISNRNLISFIGKNYKGESFVDVSISIPTVLPARTFLEKVFLLHEEFQPKPNGRKTAVIRKSRHIYDIAKLIDSEHCEAALSDQELYRKIVEHRSILTAISWVDYSKHAPKSINIIPPSDQIEEWKSDYKDMTESMFYGDVPEFADVMKKIVNLNKRINELGFDL